MPKCLICHEVQPEPLIYHPHWLQVMNAPMANKYEPIEGATYWACERCGRKHNRDNSLYDPAASRALEAKGDER